MNVETVNYLLRAIEIPLLVGCVVFLILGAKQIIKDHVGSKWDE